MRAFIFASILYEGSPGISQIHLILEIREDYIGRIAHDYRGNPHISVKAFQSASGPSEAGLLRWFRL
jgi:hypothetical protein